MNSVKKVLLFRIPMSICNLRCHYCYLSQRESSFEGIQPEMRYTPEQVARALTVERIGGVAYMNFCADGETLLMKDIDLYIKALVEEGHYAEIVTNLTITPVLEKILSWDRKLLERVEFKCSFHYLELKKKNLLDRFSENVNKIWKAGSSANIEITPSDELIPYINELKEFSIKKFGALPQLTIARDDRTSEIKKLTNLSEEEYEQTWGQFDSDFWKFKMSIFGKRQTEFCYAGAWSLYIDLTTGEASQCYCGYSIGDIFKNPDKKLPWEPIGHCPITHCYNGHALMTLGLIPDCTTVGYGDIRDRERIDGEHWLNSDLKGFFNTKLNNSNPELSLEQKKKELVRIAVKKSYLGRLVRKVKKIVKM